MQILDGRKVADDLLAHTKEEVRILINSGIQPKLAFLLIGKHPASLSYVKQKEMACQKTNIQYEHHAFPETSSTQEIISLISELNHREDIHGILVQLPLPSNIETPLVIKAINPEKDVDGFHAYNLGKMMLNKNFESLTPCTPKGIIILLETYKIPIEGQEIVMVGHSNIVGKPLSMMLLNRNATITTCHKYTKNLKAHTLRAEILIVAVGLPSLITGDMIKPGAVIVDVGINRVDGKLVGDVNFEQAKEKASFITPVPGGVGPMTVACLMANIVIACKKLTQKNS
ncbi:MAG: methenyltetrahydrofolate cyclohydrolase, methylenetetrahydrofolate dehydrogenase (NADP+) / methenyltetrahydrofolate cyclohydrolase [Candidatus Peregrinibacteria bacterium GW2011_GWE2_39_6]|nr:MAG: methenyltetrahydrofolate cyclohydrolase, methylenetetrahydrofolate dehydrogenase (NADP+) / methenyltetrahydrofolate cyclohydrolase [Candidatus Peregrinibacteria bacterium GW2011_GWF2_39_17]KKR25645.1 MAG: methenyltetrahydrofolate cyclohydrolase, methylenetetrahydrofolate dehydrogenase (NADP+) / methenyltetrahydrofolate cyclohydrolase [Candidatus Peregrinibacteria bacterium GW2011_GWE2_39_6]HCW32920.1 bifunctional methylenetetrahydrofolate dehydrogenase/methenyltetrahydrofolate cyclohydrol